MQSRVKPEVASRRVRGRWRRHEVTQLRQELPAVLIRYSFPFLCSHQHDVFVLAQVLPLFIFIETFPCSFTFRLFTRGFNWLFFLLYFYSIIQTLYGTIQTLYGTIHILYGTIILDTKLDNFVPCKISVNSFNPLTHNDH